MANSNFTIQDPVLGQVDLDNIFITNTWLIDRYVGNTLSAWGRGTVGQNGDGANSNYSSPNQINAEVNWTQVSSGTSNISDPGNFNLAIKSDGTLWGWGYNGYGQLGQNNTNNLSVPTPVGFNLVDVYYQKGVTFTEIPNIMKASKDQTYEDNPNNGTQSWTNYQNIPQKEYGIIFGWDTEYFGMKYNRIVLSRLIEFVSNAAGKDFFGYSSFSDVNKDLYSPQFPLLPKIFINCGEEPRGAVFSNPERQWYKQEGVAPNRTFTFRIELNYQPIKAVSGLSASGSRSIVEITFYEDDANSIDVQFGQNLFTPQVNSPNDPPAWDTLVTDPDFKTRQLTGVCDETKLIADFPPYQQYKGYRINTSLTRVQDASTMNWAYVSCGYNNFHAIKNDNTLWACGYNVNGELGDGTTVNKSFPVQIGSNDWSKVSSKSHSTSAIKINSTLWAWGDNTYGQLGVGSNVSSLSPQQVEADTDWSQVSMHDHTMAVKSDGSLWAWGKNNHGQLGLGRKGFILDPGSIGASGATGFVGASGASSIRIPALATSHLCGDDGVWAYIVKPVGGIVTSGSAENQFVLDTRSPRQVGSDLNWKQVEAGYDFTIAIKNDGTLWSWGLNNYGQLGHGDTLNRDIPTQIGTYNIWKQVSAFYGYAIAVRSDGTMWSWGLNDYGQLGLNDTTNRNTPIQIPGNNWKQVSAGTSNACATTYTETI